MYDIHIIQYIRHTKKRLCAFGPKWTSYWYESVQSPRTCFLSEIKCWQKPYKKTETWMRPDFDLTVLIPIKFRDGRDQFLILSTFFPPNFRCKSQGTSPSLLRCWAQSGLLSCVRPLEMRRRRRRHRAKAGAGKPSGDSQVHKYWNSTRVCVSHQCVMFFFYKDTTRSDDEKLKRLTHRWISEFDTKSCSQVDSWYEIDPLLCQKNAQNWQGFASSILQVEAWTVGAVGREVLHQESQSSTGWHLDAPSYVSRSFTFMELQGSTLFYFFAI